LPRVSGFEVIVRIRREFPNARIIILSNVHGSEDIHRAVRGGAMGYVTKGASGEELLNAIQASPKRLFAFTSALYSTRWALAIALRRPSMRCGVGWRILTNGIYRSFGLETLPSTDR
jgi:DNA-binding response OmpR family regulator